jgi:LmbE family N-acetylglucosaminyl deacetylase
MPLLALRNISQHFDSTEMSSKDLLRVSLSLLLVIALSGSFPLTTARTRKPSPQVTQLAQAIDKAEFHQALLDLSNMWTVLCVAAHPDDEDGTTLTVLRRKYGVHTASLFSTYGEGGQNSVGPELYEDLGVIRARETIAAAQIQGSEPYFLGLKDFGFSKSASEAFRVWGHDEALRRLVLKLRELRPDVIITNHDTTSGHGHHQATGRLILEAFDAAADPKRFPEQLSQASPWQAKRLFVRFFSARQTGDQPAENKAQAAQVITIDPNERDPVRGTSYAEQSLIALQHHATQGPWPKTIEEWIRAQKNETEKLALIRYRLVREAEHSAPLPDNAASFLDGLKQPETIAAKFAPPKIDDRSLTEFVAQPDRVLDALVDWRSLQSASEAPADAFDRLPLMAARLGRAFAVASGITLNISSRSAVLVPGVKTTFSVNLSNNGYRTVHVKQLSFDGWGEKTRLDAADQLVADTETSVTIDRTTPNSATVTVPRADHLYDGLLFGQPFVADADLEVNGVSFSLSAVTKLDIAPAAEITSISPSPYVWTPATINEPLSFKVAVTNNEAEPFRGALKLSSAELHIFEFGRNIALEPGESREITLQSNALPVRAGNKRTAAATSGLALFSIDRSDSHERITQRTVPVVYSAAHVVRGMRIGYVASFDQTLEDSLAALGLQAKALSVDDIQKGKLSTFDTIIIDNRGYEAHPELIAANARLLGYVLAGGTLIVFYHKANEWNPDEKNRPQLAPYPIILGSERVTDEHAPVGFLQRSQRLLNFPNRITQADFNRWIQERGLYYPNQWDRRYSALLAASDAGEPLLRGGLLVARYGRGNYIYSSMVWYRQLRAGVPGAYRMFANMISYGHGQEKEAGAYRRP